MNPEAFFPEHHQSLSEAQLMAIVEARVAQLLQGAPGELQQVLYRLDIPEHQAAEVLAGEFPEKALAGLIIAREQEKAASRAQYQRPFNASDKALSW